MLKVTEHTCGPPDGARVEVHKRVHKAKKRAREGDTSIQKIYVEELGDLHNKGYDFVTEMPTQSAVKRNLYRHRSISQGNQKEPNSRDEVMLDFAFRPMPEIVECNLEQPSVSQSIQVDPQPTVLQKIQTTKNILEKTIMAPASASPVAESATPSSSLSGDGQHLEKRPRRETAADEHLDDDKMFLLSLSGKMKHLSPANNMEFRLGVQQLLLNFLRSESNTSRAESTSNAFCTSSAQNNPVSSSTPWTYPHVLIKEEVDEPFTDETPLTVEDTPPVTIKTEVINDNPLNMEYN